MMLTTEEIFLENDNRWNIEMIKMLEDREKTARWFIGNDEWKERRVVEGTTFEDSNRKLDKMLDSCHTIRNDIDKVKKDIDKAKKDIKLSMLKCLKIIDKGEEQSKYSALRRLRNKRYWFRKPLLKLRFLIFAEFDLYSY